MSEANEVHTCVLCNNKLESKEALKDHFRKHANKEIDSKGRPVGPKGVAEFDIIKAKERGYEKGTASKFVDGVITCDVCGEKFKCNTMAIQHKFRKHPFSAHKFYCPQCGMQFPLKIHRDRHLADHSPPQSKSEVKCNDCGEAFYNKGALDYHHRSMHQRIISLYCQVLTPPPSKKIKVNNAGDPQSVYYCHLCGFEYIVKFNLQKHLERTHTEEERNNAPLDLIKCTTCDALFYNQKGYQNHNMYHKPDDLYVTSEQQRLQTVTRVDQDFDIRRVQLGAEKFLPLPSYRNRRKAPIVRIPKTVPKKPAGDSSDEMSPPSSMDTSSESESEQPLEKRLNAAKKETPKEPKKPVKNTSVKVNNSKTKARENKYIEIKKVKNPKRSNIVTKTNYVTKKSKVPKNIKSTQKKNSEDNKYNMKTEEIKNEPVEIKEEPQVIEGGCSS